MSADTPVIAANHPIKVSLETGKNYAFCTCGQSQNQPYCDGSHVGTTLKPKMFKVESNADAYLCQCKHTSNPPYCDGSHKAFTAEQVGKPGPGAAPEEP